MRGMWLRIRNSRASSRPAPLGRTRTLLNTYLLSALIYLTAQELLNLFIYAWDMRLALKTFVFHSSYFFFPAISAVLILAFYLLLKRKYRPMREHYLLHALSWGCLLIPQLVSAFLNELNIVYVAWSFILATTAGGTVVFQDLCLMHPRGAPAGASRFIHGELRFYLDKLSVAWLTLGTVLAVCMTILWTAPMTSFQMSFEERVFWAVYMAGCFLTVTVLVFVFVAYPILRGMREAREIILTPEGPRTEETVAADGGRRELLTKLDPDSG